MENAFGTKTASMWGFKAAWGISHTAYQDTANTMTNSRNS